MIQKPFIAMVLALVVLCQPAEAAEMPKNFLYMGSGDLAENLALLKRSDIGGLQVVYNWKALEPSKGVYDFSRIEQDLLVAQSLNKKLFIQIQDRFFDPAARNVPAYLLEEPEYTGGISPQLDNPGENKPVTYGWVAQQWNPKVSERYQALLAALADRFDGKVFGVNLPESAIDVDMKHPPEGFGCDAYFTGEMENLAFARKVFTQSHVVQYVNFWPCEWENDHNYMGRLFAFAAENGIGLGGPDIVPNKKAQMKNSYPFFNRYKGKLSMVGMAVQEPTLTYKNKATGKPFTKTEFTEFATDYLGVSIIFWSPSSPWLRH